MNSNRHDLDSWQVEKIAVVGPGIVGMPMAAMLAHAGIQMGMDKPASVVVVQRNSPTSGWKVDSINAGKSPIGGIEPDLDRIVAGTVEAGVLSASHDYAELRDADVILVCVQTDKDGLGPDYGPLFDALTNIAVQLQKKPAHKVPLIIFESTLAPSSVLTVIKEHFAKHDLLEGQDVLLGNSPNRVMPGRLVQRVAESDKLIGGISPVTPQLIKRLYAHIVTQGKLYLTNCFTAEIVKTLENAYRDVRIAYAAEIVRYSDLQGIDFYQLREKVNALLSQGDQASHDPNAVPSGGLLVPTIGVGGHCLPKDGILLLWRQLEQKSLPQSLILASRQINDASPAETIKLAERAFGDMAGVSVALLGTAYRFNSEDTRNSPTLTLAQLLLDKDAHVCLQDPYVKPGDQKLVKFGLHRHFTRNLEKSLASAEIIIFCTAHKNYLDSIDSILAAAPKLRGVLDGCNLFEKTFFQNKAFAYAGIGKSDVKPSPEFVNFVYEGFRAMERGVANEVWQYVDFANTHYVTDDFNWIDFKDVQRIAATCVTGCSIVGPGPIASVPNYDGFESRLARCAYRAQGDRRRV